MWREAIMNYFTELSYNLPGGTDESHAKPQTEQPISRPKLIPYKPEYEAGILKSIQQHSAFL
jgi:hypothetical protein